MESKSYFHFEVATYVSVSKMSLENVLSEF